MDFWIMFSSFLIGTVGALFVVWLRWIGTLPTFSSSIEIQGCEEEYKKITRFISKKLEDQKEITESEEKYSNDLRDDLWRQKTKSFLTSAILYTILGGATAVLFVGLELQSITDSANITKLLAAGALWTTFYSFIDVKKTSAAIDSKKEAIDETISAKTEEIVSNLQKQLENEKNKVIEYADKYNHVVEAYNELAKENGGK